MPIEHVVFDWSGTLCDTFGAFLYTYEAICREFGKEPRSVDDVRRTFTIPYMRFWNIDFPTMTLEQEQELYGRHIANAPGASRFPHVVETLCALRRNGYRLHVLSSDKPATLLPQMHDAGLDGFFVSVATDVYDKSKGLEEFLDGSRLDSRRVAYVGDTDGDMRAARAARVRAVAISWGFQHRDVLELSPHDHLIESIEELPVILDPFL